MPEKKPPYVIDLKLNLGQKNSYGFETEFTFVRSTTGSEDILAARREVTAMLQECLQRLTDQVQLCYPELVIEEGKKSDRLKLIADAMREEPIRKAELEDDEDEDS